MLIDWFTVAAEAVNFLILVWLLKRFLYRPVLSAIDAREKLVASQMEAKQAKMMASREQAEFLRKNEDFARERDRLLLEGRTAAQHERDVLLEKARERDEFRNLNQKLGLLAQREVFAIARKTLIDLADASLDERMTALFVRRLLGLPIEKKRALAESLKPNARPTLVRTASELSTAQKQSVAEALREITGREIKVEFTLAAPLIGGIELVADSQKIAWTIDGYLISLSDAIRDAAKIPRELEIGGLVAHAT